jgi:hypothetical protein
MYWLTTLVAQTPERGAKQFCDQRRWTWVRYENELVICESELARNSEEPTRHYSSIALD